MRRMAFSYGCVMVRLPMLLAQEVRGYAASIPAGYLRKTEDASTGIPDETHITVKYGLTTEDEEQVAEVIAGTEPFVVRLGRAGVFHNADEIVIRLMVESLGLRELYNRICKELPHVNTYRDFRPHVTVAYLVKNDDDPYYYRAFFSDDFEGQEFEAGQVIFSTASGNKSVISFDGSVIPMELEMAARTSFTARR